MSSSESDAYVQFSEYSRDSNSSSESNSDMGLLPYQFEPVEDGTSGSSESSQSEIEDSEEQQTVGVDDLSWCKCGKCRAMDNENHRVCCRQVSEAVSKLQDR